MQTEYPRWSLRCLLVVGGHAGGSDFAYETDPVCPSLALRAPDTYLDLGHKVKALITWVADQLSGYDFLLKTDMDTLICFTMLMDKLDSLVLRFGGRKKIYLGHAETCSKSALQNALLLCGLQ